MFVGVICLLASEFFLTEIIVGAVDKLLALCLDEVHGAPQAVVVSARPIYHAVGGLVNQAEPPVKECPSFIRVQLVFLPELLGVEHLGE